MLIYIFVYAASSIFCELGFRQRRKFFSLLLLGIAVVVPALIAGARDITMGTDRLVYGDDVFRDVCQSADLFHLETRWTGWIETGYVYFTYAVSLITHQVSHYYFFLSLVENVFVVLSIRLFGFRRYAGLAYLTFLFMFFQPAFNMIRQALALSLLLYATALYVNKKKIWSVVFFGLAYSIHHSSIIFLVFPLLDYFNNKYHNMKTYIIEGVVILIVCTIAGRLLDAFAPVLDISVGRYRQYFTATGSSSFSVTEFLLAMMFAGIVFINRSRLNENKMYLPLSIGVIGIPLSQIGAFGGDFISRVSTFFLWLQIPCFAAVVSVSSKKKTTLRYIVLYLVMYWFYHYIYMGWNHTYPYSSQILGF